MDASQVLAAVAASPPAAVIAYGVSRHARATLCRTDGFATSGRVARVLSERAARRSGRQTRPGLSRPATHPAEAFGRLLGRTVRPEGGRRCFARWEDVVMVLAPPRGGKTALLGHYVIDAPGACLVTSTKVDILTHTQILQAARGPVWVLNPEGMAGLASTLRWSPIPGCADPARAIATAAYMVAAVEGGSGLQDHTFWDGQNAKVLRSLLYAAAGLGATMWDLATWITNPDDPAPLDFLQDHPDTPPQWFEALHQVTTASDKTRNAVYLTLQRVVEFMADPAIAAATVPDPDGPGGAGGQGAFDVDAFVNDGSGTLYLLGSVKAHGGMGPLFAALTGLIFEAAKRRSQALPAGRLDPPLTLVLDEATNICPVPLPQWASDAGGRGIALTYAIQSPSQMEARWGHAGKETVWQSSNCKVILGGLSVAKDLAEISELLGHRDECVPVPYHPQAHRQAPTMRRVPVMSPAQIRQLPEGRALVLYRSLPPVEIVMRPVWERRDVRRAKASGGVGPADEPNTTAARCPDLLGAGGAVGARWQGDRAARRAPGRRGGGAPTVTDPTTLAALARLDAQLAALGPRVADLEKVVTALAGPEGAAAAPRAWWWPDLDRLAATAAWGTLGAWVRDALLARHPDHERTLYPCWRRHPDVVDELTALRVVWLDAYDNPKPTATAAAEYLRRLPVTMERIKAQLGGCRAGRDATHRDRTRSTDQHWDGEAVAQFITADVQDRPEPTS